MRELAEDLCEGESMHACLCAHLPRVKQAELKQKKFEVSVVPYLVCIRTPSSSSLSFSRTTTQTIPTGSFWAW